MIYGFESSPSSSSSDDDFPVVPEMRPTDLLSLAMKKRRALYNQKERNMRCEVLQTSFITSLCKHMGESRKRHRRGGKKRSRSNSSSSVCSTNSDITPCGVEPNNNVEPLVQNDQHQLCVAEPIAKKAKTSNFMDPFGLEDFFKGISSRSVKGCLLLS
ncbi:Target Of Splicing [Caenorhabditis elegans]|uniref:Target Of Splicing n=1 Tax=Caenorhabditis elegans TaxID=6239 RepID=Q95R01_CAEEL|nr:Target Of Splicing [Caenorhabditis elegans]CCD68622.2 Target Of Splicing [Caenorhabditis elegans]|eukprot:NP_505418.2 Target Of Splicing [Caenorhabditis elegans]